MYIKLKQEWMRGNIPDVKLVDGTWLAGGCVRRWFKGEPQSSDFDVFCKGDDSEKLFVDKNCLGLPDIETRTASTWIRNRDERRIQVIKIRYECVEKCLDSFDYHLSQFAFDGNNITATIPAVISTLRGDLSVHEFQKGFELDSLRRAFKYAKSGYSPCMGTIRDIAIILSGCDQDQIKEQFYCSISSY